MKFANKKLRAAAHDYVGAFLEACAEKKVKEPLDALVNTDAYPRLQKMPEIEHAIGWMNGCADAIGIPVEKLFRHVAAEINAVTRAKDVVTKALDKSVAKIQRGIRKARA